jgi:oligoribonuclease
MANNDLLVWIDCEMTGLDLDVDELVEIAVIVTDSQLAPLDAGLQLVIKPHTSALENMVDFVREMHTSSGLISEINDGVSVEEAQAMVLEYLDGLVPEGTKPPLAGNSVGTDRAFLVRYMPILEGRLHYRTIDVSTIKELSRRWQPRVYFNAPAKRNGHRALDDIRESIRELDYYRASVFDASGDITTEQAQKATAAMGKKYPDLV